MTNVQSALRLLLLEGSNGVNGCHLFLPKPNIICHLTNLLGAEAEVGAKSANFERKVKSLLES